MADNQKGLYKQRHNIDDLSKAKVPLWFLLPLPSSLASPLLSFSLSASKQVALRSNQEIPIDYRLITQKHLGRISHMKRSSNSAASGRKHDGPPRDSRLRKSGGLLTRIKHGNDTKTLSHVLSSYKWSSMLPSWSTSNFRQLDLLPSLANRSSTPIMQPLRSRSTDTLPLHHAMPSACRAGVCPCLLQWWWCLSWTKQRNP